MTTQKEGSQSLWPDIPGFTPPVGPGMEPTPDEREWHEERPRNLANLFKRFKRMSEDRATDNREGGK